MIDNKTKALFEDFVTERVSNICVKTQRDNEYKELTAIYNQSIDNLAISNDLFEKINNIRCQMEQKKYENIYVNAFQDALFIAYLNI